jgi:ATP-binding cassette subfamily B protein
VSRARAALAFVMRAAPGAALGVILLSLIAAQLPVGAAWLMRDVFDRLTGSGEGLLPLVVAVAIVGAAVGVASSGLELLNARMGRAVGLRAVDRLYLAMNRIQGIGRMEDPVFRDELQLAQQAGRSGPSQFFSDLLAVAQASVTLAGFLITLTVVNPWMAVAVLVCAVPAIIAHLRLADARTRLLYRNAARERREMHYADLLTSLPAAKELRLLGLGDLFRGRMLRELSAAHADQARHDRKEFGVDTALGATTALLTGIGLGWAVVQAASGRITIGDVSVFLAALVGVQSAAQSAIGRFGSARRSLSLYAYFQRIETAEPDVADRGGRVPALRGAIELDNVWFRYAPDQPWVLQGVTLTIPYGRSLALVGLNGAGKSTLIKLLCRFYEPTHGRITWDGIDLRRLGVTALRDRIGAVFQDYMQYDLSAAENIGIGDAARMHDRAGVVAAAQRAGIHDVIAGLPRSYDTLLSTVFASEADEGDPVTGMVLSGGQWQRLALARAFMRDQRDLLVLDEPAAGLDARAEHELHERLRAHRQGRTSILISHRLGTVRSADKIVVLDGGRIAEEGTHARLMAADGVYAGLFRLQATDYQDELVPT